MTDLLVRTACVAQFPAFKGDCSGFARAVAGQVGVPLVGLADEIVETLRSGPDWTPIAGGMAAAEAAISGLFVMAGLKGAEQHMPDPHGHVVVIVGGQPNRGEYPFAYWGSLGGNPGADLTLNWAWTSEDRDRISYSSHPLGGA